MESRLHFVSPMDRALFLKSLYLLRDLSSSELAALSQHAVERSFGRGERVFTPGTPVGSFHLVVEGRVRVLGGEYGEAEVGPSGILGLFSLLARNAEGLDAECTTDVITLHISAEALLEVYEDNFNVLLRQIRSLAGITLAERKQIPTGTYLAADVPPAGGELGLIDRLFFILGGGMTTSANMDALVEMTRNLTEVHHEAGVVLWRPGDPSGFTLPLVQGTVRCVIPGEEERWFRAGPGYPLGNIESMAASPRWYEAVTETPVVALRGDTDRFLDMLEDHFEMAMDFTAAMAQGIIRILEQKRAGIVPGGG